MDFFEKTFGFAPDGGDGSFELLLFAVPVAGLCYLALRMHRRKRLQRPDAAAER